MAGVCAKYGVKTDGENRFKIGDVLITIYRQYQNDLHEAVKDLQNREFHYTEAPKLTLIGMVARRRRPSTMSSPKPLSEMK